VRGAGRTVALVLSLASAASAAPRVIVLDDGVKVMREQRAPLEESPWPSGAIDLFAMRGETIALQVVIEADAAPVDGARVLLTSFASSLSPLDVRVTRYVERFVPVLRPSGNDGEPGSLAFTAKAAPRDSFVGGVADPLVPEAYDTARAAPGQRAAVWVDLSIPLDARADTYRSALLVRAGSAELAMRPIVLRVLPEVLPAAPPTAAFVYYDTRELTRRLGDARAEGDLRATLHAYRVDAIHDVTISTLSSDAALALERASLRDESVVAYGAYGALGEPTPASLDVATRLDVAIFGDRPADRARVSRFIYAVDEDCDSPWPARWRALVASRPSLRGVRVGATCGLDPSAQAADLVMQTAHDYDPERARRAERAGKEVWAYNGCRPYAGPMMLDVPAVDLRANAWIALRYGVPRWFYWEATAWFDDGRGGHGGEQGFDPFMVAETFHNREGDYANGDGILLYPGKQEAGRVSFGQDTVFPSVRLANLRRGLEDAGYVALARTVDRARADEVVRRMVPHALALARERAAWPSQARPWLEARRELAAILERPAPSASSGDGVRASAGCSLSPAHAAVGLTSARGDGALFLVWGIASWSALRARRRRAA
jgi:hypothetical protein